MRSRHEGRDHERGRLPGRDHTDSQGLPLQEPGRRLRRCDRRSGGSCVRVPAEPGRPGRVRRPRRGPARDQRPGFRPEPLPADGRREARVRPGPAARHDHRLARAEAPAGRGADPAAGPTLPARRRRHRARLARHRCPCDRRARHRRPERPRDRRGDPARPRCASTRRADRRRIRRRGVRPLRDEARPRPPGHLVGDVQREDGETASRRTRASPTGSTRPFRNAPATRRSR